MVKTIDLQFFTDLAIAAFIIPSNEGPILIETGPYSTFPTLKKGIEAAGYSIEEIKHVLLSHIHFDHAGAAWALADHGASIYVHPIGQKHLHAPERLYDSARRIYGDAMEKLWGEMRPIPMEKLIVPQDKESISIGEHHFVAHYTPGHAKHHIAWEFGKIIFAGDVAGCAIDNGPVFPPCPPPDIDIEAWKKSIDLLKGLSPEALYLTHFGKIDTVETHLDQLNLMLDDWAHFIKTGMDEGKDIDQLTTAFTTYTEKQLIDQGLSESDISRYEAANPTFMSVAGLMRYWKKKAEKN